MPPVRCAFGWNCLDIFLTPCRDRCAGLLSACLIYASGQIWVKMKHPTRWLLLACSFFFFFIPFALSSFQSSAQRDRVPLLYHSQVVCVSKCVCVCVYICVMRRDKHLHPPLRHRIPQPAPFAPCGVLFIFPPPVPSFFFFSSSSLSLLFFCSLSQVEKRHTEEWKGQDSN